MNASIRVVVADDQDAVRAGVVLVLDSAADIAVIGEARDGDEAIELALRLRPDVVVMDVRMPRLDGIAATRELAAEGVDVLMLTTFDLDEYVFGALRAGAAGFVLKDTDADGLIDAVRHVARGDGIIAPAVTRRLIAAFGAARPPGGQDRALEVLTPRERDVLACIGAGLSNVEISGRLAMAESTTKTHVSRILAKLGLRSRVQAAILAQEAGIAAPPSADGTLR